MKWKTKLREYILTANHIKICRDEENNFRKCPQMLSTENENVTTAVVSDSSGDINKRALHAYMYMTQDSDK